MKNRKIVEALTISVLLIIVGSILILFLAYLKEENDAENAFFPYTVQASQMFAVENTVTSSGEVVKVKEVGSISESEAIYHIFNNDTTTPNACSNEDFYTRDNFEETVLMERQNKIEAKRIKTLMLSLNSKT